MNTLRTYPWSIKYIVVNGFIEIELTTNEKVSAVKANHMPSCLHDATIHLTHIFATPSAEGATFHRISTPYQVEETECIAQLNAFAFSTNDLTQAKGYDRKITNVSFDIGPFNGK